MQAIVTFVLSVVHFAQACRPQRPSSKRLLLIVFMQVSTIRDIHRHRPLCHSRSNWRTSSSNLLHSKVRRGFARQMWSCIATFPISWQVPFFSRKWLCRRPASPPDGADGGSRRHATKLDSTTNDTHATTALADTPTAFRNTQSWCCQPCCKRRSSGCRCCRPEWLPGRHERRPAGLSGIPGSLPGMPACPICAACMLQSDLECFIVSLVAQE